MSSMLAILAAAALALPNGGIWKDTDGVHVNAHGGGLLKDGDVWYWYGEHKIGGGAGNRAHVGVGCYSSRDLVTWKNEGIALAVSTKEGHDIEKECILERPKVVKAPATGKYAMLFHLERKGLGYKDARVGFAVSDSPTGPFKFVRSCRPVDEKMMSRDMTVFADDDGSVWHIFASEENSTLHFAELAGDCLGYTGRWYRGAERHWTEAPAVVKHGGWYWILGSGCTGWKPNAADFPLALGATSTSGLPVRYFVREGPAVVGDDGVLRLRDWPAGAKECDVTVCAYQWGVDGGKVKTAEPVFATIRVTR